MEEEDPLTLPGPSFKCVTMNNVKIELEETESQSDSEEWQTNVEFKTEVKEELDVEEYGVASGEYANADDEELLEVESVPKEVSNMSLLTCVTCYVLPSACSYTK